MVRYFTPGIYIPGIYYVIGALAVRAVTVYVYLVTCFTCRRICIYCCRCSYSYITRSGQSYVRYRVVPGIQVQVAWEPILLGGEIIRKLNITQLLKLSVIIVSTTQSVELTADVFVKKNVYKKKNLPRNTQGVAIQEQNFENIPGIPDIRMNRAM